MKRAFSFDYSSDEEDDVWLANVLDEWERQLQSVDMSDNDDADSDVDEDWWFSSDDEADQRLAAALDDYENHSLVKGEWDRKTQCLGSVPHTIDFLGR